jgi:hypothetical protein
MIAPPEFARGVREPDTADNSKPSSPHPSG